MQGQTEPSDNYILMRQSSVKNTVLLISSDANFDSVGWQYIIVTQQFDSDQWIL